MKKLLFLFLTLAMYVTSSFAYTSVKFIDNRGTMGPGSCPYIHYANTVAINKAVTLHVNVDADSYVFPGLREGHGWGTVSAYTDNPALTYDVSVFDQNKSVVWSPNYTFCTKFTSIYYDLSYQGSTGWTSIYWVILEIYY